MSEKVNCKNFGKELEKKFFEIEVLIRDFRLPEKTEIEAHQLHFLINNHWPEPSETIYNACFFPQSEAQTLSIVGNMLTLGLKIPKEYANHFLFQHRETKDLRETIVTAIQKGTITDEVLFAWGEYNFSAAAIISLIANNASETFEKTSVKKNIPNLIERYIFAFWMHEHWILGNISKEQARDNLALKIETVLDKINDYPNWKVSALKNMLAEDQSGIKKTYSDISKNQIIDMIKNKKNLKQIIEII
jgi:hypothetical protein